MKIKKFEKRKIEEDRETVEFNDDYTLSVRELIEELKNEHLDDKCYNIIAHNDSTNMVVLKPIETYEDFKNLIKSMIFFKSDEK